MLTGLRFWLWPDYRQENKARITKIVVSAMEQIKQNCNEGIVRTGNEAQVKSQQLAVVRS